MVNPALIALAAVALAAILVVAVAWAVGARRQQVSTERGEMSVSILPRSSVGWWSVGLAIAFVLALLAVTALPSEDLLDAESHRTLSVVLKVLFIGISGVSFVAGLFSLIRRRQVSILVLLGMLVSLWLGLVTMVAHFFME
jgi:hypothetical protein